MRIALIAPPWIPVPPPAYGGTEAVVDQLARGLHAAGHDVLLCASGDSTCPVPLHATVPAALTAERGMTAPELAHVLDAYAAAGPADVVHDHTVAGGLLPAAAGPVRVVTHHGTFDRVHRRILTEVARHAAVVAISHDQASHAPAGAVTRVIHHGIDVDAVPLGPGGGGYLLHLGRLSPDKGVLEAVEVAERAGMPLVVAAKCRERDERSFLDDVLRPRLSSTIRYVGEVGTAAKHELLGGALALVNPIQWDEPFGLVMVEALAAGTPVLATVRGAAPEIVEPGRTGWLSDDLDELARVARRADRFDREACRCSVAQRFSTTRMVGEHIELYESLLAGHRPPRGPSGSIGTALGPDPAGPTLRASAALGGG